MSANDMEASACAKKQILRNFAHYLPVTVISIFLYFVFIAMGLTYVLEGRIEDDTALWVAFGTAAILAVAGGILYVGFVVNRWSRSRMTLTDRTLNVCGPTSTGLVEKQYFLDEIAAITFGEKLDSVEKVMDLLHHVKMPKTSGIRLIKDLKAGRMRITDNQGRHVVFHFIDKVFDLDSLEAIASELIRRGVNVSVTGPT